MNVAYFVVQQTMYFAIPLLIVAIGAMYSERSGVINIALEGIMVMGAFAGIFFINIFQGTLSGQGLFLLAMLVAGLTGGLFSLLHAFASINMKADQTISGTALNLFAPALADLLCGAAIWIGPTLIIKFIMAWIMGIIWEQYPSKIISAIGSERAG